MYAGCGSATGGAGTSWWRPWSSARPTSGSPGSQPDCTRWWSCRPAPSGRRCGRQPGRGSRWRGSPTTGTRGRSRQRRRTVRGTGSSWGTPRLPNTPTRRRWRPCAGPFRRRGRADPLPARLGLRLRQQLRQPEAEAGVAGVRHPRTYRFGQRVHRSPERRLRPVPARDRCRTVLAPQLDVRRPPRPAGRSAPRVTVLDAPEVWRRIEVGGVGGRRRGGGQVLDLSQDRDQHRQRVRADVPQAALLAPPRRGSPAEGRLKSPRWLAGGSPAAAGSTASSARCAGPGIKANRRAPGRCA
ncbi:hypothetical protein SCYAM73S_04537 [Streptomyces cyaneofuscatus]